MILNTVVLKAHSSPEWTQSYWNSTYITGVLTEETTFSPANKILHSDANKMPTELYKEIPLSKKFNSILKGIRFILKDTLEVF